MNKKDKKMLVWGTIIVIGVLIVGVIIYGGSKGWFNTVINTYYTGGSY